jgi:hypothetical protein
VGATPGARARTRRATGPRTRRIDTRARAARAVRRSAASAGSCTVPRPAGAEARGGRRRNPPASDAVRTHRRRGSRCASPRRVHRRPGGGRDRRRGRARCPSHHHAACRSVGGSLRRRPRAPAVPARGPAAPARPG